MKVLNMWGSLQDLEKAKLLNQGDVACGSVFLIVSCKIVTLRAENIRHNLKSGKVNGERKWSNVFFSCKKIVEMYLHLSSVQTE